MAIDIQCPACKKNYKLKDELAGKKVTCANPKCRFVFPVPKIGTGTAPTLAAMKAAKAPAAPAIDAETAALAALADDPDDMPTESRVIPMTCESCEHTWTETWDKQGKNTLCPSCRHRQKVPIPENKKLKSDWRKGGPGPSMARREQLEGVTASGDAAYVSGEALRSVGLGVPEMEPRPLWQKIFVVAFPILLIGLGTFAYLAYNRSRTDNREVETMSSALAELPDAKDTTLPKNELAFYRAALFISAAEYYAVRDKSDAKELTETMSYVAKARSELEDAPTGAERDYLFRELCKVIVQLGGTPEQIENGHRIRWTPQGGGSSRARISEKTFDVQKELQLTMNAMRTQDRVVALEVRKHIFRVLARDLAKRGEGEWLERLVPSLFADEEQLEGTAIVGWELFKVTANKEFATTTVSNLAGGANPSPVLLSLAQVLDAPPPALKLPAYSTGTGPLDDNSRASQGMTALLKGNPAEAIEIAKRPGRIDGRLRLLLLIAETTAEPGNAVIVAAEIVTADGRKKELGIPADDVLISLSLQAGRAGQTDKLEVFTKFTGSAATRSLARAAFLQGQHLGNVKLSEEALLEIPTEAKDYVLGHACGRLQIARANGKAGIPLPADKYESWGKGTLKPFGLAGFALGRQDQNVSR